MSGEAPLLETCDLKAGYGDFQALFGISVAIAARSTLAIIGANGAGKSTFLKAVTGLLPARRDAILFDGEPIGGLPAPEVMKRGIAMVPEGRRLFPSLSVEENLLIGSWGRKGSGAGGCRASTSCSPSWRSGATIPAPRCRAASSRWWRSAGR